MKIYFIIVYETLLITILNFGLFNPICWIICFVGNYTFDCNVNSNMLSHKLKRNRKEREERQRKKREKWAKWILELYVWTRCNSLCINTAWDWWELCCNGYSVFAMTASSDMLRSFFQNLKITFSRIYSISLMLCLTFTLR